MYYKKNALDVVIIFIYSFFLYIMLLLPNNFPVLDQ